jgi:ribosome maturation factor RimP
LQKVRATARLERLAQVVEGSLPEGSELVETRFSAGPMLTLLVDRQDGPVDHEFCSCVVSAVSPALETEGYDGPFEVSSPGIERPLTKPEHFRRFVGRQAKVRTTEPVGERNFVLRLLEGGGAVELPFGSVTRAHLKEDIKA